MTPPEHALNPYAPPSSDVTIASVKNPEPMKRPASVKWAWVYLGLLVVLFAFHDGRHIARTGVAQITDTYLTYPIVFIMPTLRLTALILLTTSARRPIIYWVGTIALASRVCEMGIRLWLASVSVDFNALDSHALPLFGLAVPTGVVLFLFYRFTFGLPSRQYFRVAKMQPAAPEEVGVKASADQ